MIKAGEAVIQLPAGMQAEISGEGEVRLKLQGREVSKNFKSSGIRIEKENNSIRVICSEQRKSNYATMKTTASHINNMIAGLQHGYEYKLEVVYSHFPINIAVKGGYVEISNFAGAKKPVKAKIIGDAKVEVKGKEIRVKASSKEDGGQTAANLEQATRIKERDVRVFQDGIYITSKPKSIPATGVEGK